MSKELYWSQFYQSGAIEQYLNYCKASQISGDGQRDNYVNNEGESNCN